MQKKGEVRMWKSEDWEQFQECLRKGQLGEEEKQAQTEHEREAKKSEDARRKRPRPARKAKRERGGEEKQEKTADNEHNNRFRGSKETEQSTIIKNENKRKRMGEVFQEKVDPGGRKGNASLKYLGVWFDTQWGWRTQRAVLRNKIKERTSYIEVANLPLEVAIYAANSTIIPMALYSLQVAVVPVGTLNEWDSKVKQAVMQAGKMNSNMITEGVYLSKEDGGMGVKNIRDEADASRIKLTYS